MRFGGLVLLRLSTLLLLTKETSESRGSCRVQASVPFQSDTSKQRISVEIHVLLSSECSHIGPRLRVYWLNASFEIALLNDSGDEHIVQLGQPPTGCHAIKIEVWGPPDAAVDALDAAFTRICVAQPSAGVVGSVAEIDAAFGARNGLSCSQVCPGHRTCPCVCIGLCAHSRLQVMREDATGELAQTIVQGSVSHRAYFRRGIRLRLDSK